MPGHSGDRKVLVREVVVTAVGIQDMAVDPNLTLVLVLQAQAKVRHHLAQAKVQHRLTQVARRNKDPAYSPHTVEDATTAAEPPHHIALVSHLLSVSQVSS